jgi:virulence factor
MKILILKKLRIALIGLGDIAQKAYLPIIANHQEIQPILCTRNAATLANLQRQYRIDEGYKTIAELIATQPDAVMIHSATASHFQIAKQCFEAGIATFVDKPLSYSLAECEILISLARDKNLPLYIGFNRRFAPLITPLSERAFTHVRWQKNRVALPALAREFIYDDYIHVLDGLLFLSGCKSFEKIENINVHAITQDNLLCSLHSNFTINGTLFEGSMNRISGHTEERVEVFLNDEKVQIESLTKGEHYQSGTLTLLGFNDWQSHLYTRGFIDMIDNWLDDIKSGLSNDSRLREIQMSHQLCEHMMTEILAQK